jgi:hypothetical protein
MKKLCALVVLVTAFFFAAKAIAEEFRLIENLRHEQIELPASIPDRSVLGIVDYDFMLIDDEGAAGILIYYDDRQTKWDVDYIEFYDVEGNLLLVSWIDRFGGCQVAVDRGLLKPDEPRVDRTLVVIGVGEAL